MKRTKTPYLLASIGGLFLLLVIAPFALPQYWLHILILILIWSSIATAWSYMARFGVVSLGHGAVIGIGTYASALLFNYWGVSPLIGMIAGAVLSVVFFAGIGYFCFRFGVTGHYFAVTTLVMVMVVYLLIIYFRDFTGGSLGMTIKPLGTEPLFFQFDEKAYFYFVSLFFLAITLYVSSRIQRSRIQRAMTAIDNDEDAASSVGIPIVKYKTMVTAFSSFFTAIGGVIYMQYMMTLHPDVLASVDASLAIAFKAILGGMYTVWGPLVGTTLIVGLEEYFRVVHGSTLIGWSVAAYGIVIIILIIFFPQGLYGTLKEVVRRKWKTSNCAFPEETQRRVK
jgi:branched-chain amino acid transport system permease protein